MNEPRAPSGQGALGREGPERRAAVRFSYFARVIGEYAADAANPVIEGRICDLSLNGVGMIVHRPLKPGATISLTLYQATGIFRCDRTVRVIDARPEDSGSWRARCEFTVPLTAAELRWLQVQDFTPRQDTGGAASAPG